MRQLIPVVGAAIHAVSTVLAAFMTGLALGSWLGGRWVDKVERSPLRAYAVLEFLIGVSAVGISLCFPILSAAGEFRLVPAFVLLLVPTFMMGATLPILSKLVSDAYDSVGEHVGTLYSANTSGAVLGVVLGGFILIPRLGLRNTLWVGVALNLLVALVCALVPDHKVETQPAEESEAVKRPLAVALFTCSGFLALAFEVVWTRTLASFLGTSVYAFSVMLLVFLAGIALGSGLMSQFSDGLKNPYRTLGFLLTGVGLFGLVARQAVTVLPKIMFGLGEHLNSFGTYLVFQVILASLVLLPQTLLFGAVFPVVARIVSPSLEKLGQAVGDAYFANTCGSICGSLVAGFVFIPYFGVERSVWCLCLFALGVGSLTLWKAGSRKGVAAAAVSLLGLALISAPWDPKIALHAPYMAPKALKTMTYQDHQARLAENQVLFRKDGLHASILVSEDQDKARSLSLDGWIVASAMPHDRFNQEAIGHLPMLLARDTEAALVIGLGTGMTAAALARNEPKILDVAELEPVIVEAAHQFEEHNAPLWNLPGTRFNLGDGRSFVDQTDQLYDVITSDPLHPFSRGAGSLYTVEHFKNCKDKLKPNGVMLQWLPLYGLSEQDVKTVIASFLEAFPEASYWCWYPRPAKGDTMLIGRKSNRPFSYSLLAERYKALQAQGVTTWSSPLDIMAGFLMEGELLKAFVSGAPLNTDDRPVLEFSAPSSLYDRRRHSPEYTIQSFIEFSGTALPSFLPRDPAVLREYRKALDQYGRTQKAMALPR